MGIHERKLTRLLTENAGAEILRKLRTTNVRRSRLEITIDFMRVIYVMQGEALLTRTASLSNMTYVKAQRLAESLELKGMVRVTVKGRTRRRYYELTPKGVETLGHFIDVLESMSLEDIERR